MRACANHPNPRPRPCQLTKTHFAACFRSKTTTALALLATMTNDAPPPASPLEARDSGPSVAAYTHHVHVHVEPFGTPTRGRVEHSGKEYKRNNFWLEFILRILSKSLTIQVGPPVFSQEPTKHLLGKIQLRLSIYHAIWSQQRHITQLRNMTLPTWNKAQLWTRKLRIHHELPYKEHRLTRTNAK